jgi:predicted nucleic acid-binding protein
MHAARYAQGHGVFTFTSVTVFEVAYGLEFQGASAQLSKVVAWMSRNEQITPVDADYVSAATIKAMARRQGSVLEFPDCLIAGVAARLRLPLVTGNTHDFKAVQRTGVGLSIENCRDA